MTDKIAYVKTMTAKCFDIDAGKPIAILHENDAKEIGILPLERIEITNPQTNSKLVTVVDITKTIVRENEVGIFANIVKVTCFI